MLSIVVGSAIAFSPVQPSLGPSSAVASLRSPAPACSLAQSRRAAILGGAAAVLTAAPAFADDLEKQRAESYDTMMDIAAKNKAAQEAEKAAKLAKLAKQKDKGDTKAAGISLGLNTVLGAAFVLGLPTIYTLTRTAQLATTKKMKEFKDPSTKTIKFKGPWEK